VILGHHGGELQLLQAVLASAAAAPVLLLPIRSELSRLARQLRRRPGRDDNHDTMTTKETKS
jgi:hypothetical protein